MDILQKLNHKGTMLIQDQEEWSYEEFCEKVIERAKEIAAQKLPRIIAIKAAYTIRHWVDFFALLYNKHIVFPYLNKAPNYHWLDGEFASNNIADRKADKYEELDRFIATNQAGIILETSGTSGTKKVVLHNFDKLAKKYVKLHRKFKTVLVFSPEHISGIETLLSIVIPGGTVIIPSDQSINNICNTIEEKKIDLLACTPSLIRLAMVSGNIQKLSSIQILNLGGEQTDENLLYKIKQYLPSTQICQAFGTTETANIRTYTLEGTSYFKPGTEGVDFIVKDSVLWLKKTDSIECFLEGRPKTEEGWICTNDRIEQNDKGFIKIQGRLEKTINIGGEKVDPVETENTIIQMEGIISVKIYSEDDMIMGKKLVADICVEQGQTLTKKDILLYCRTRLAQYKIPVKFHIHNEIALTSRLKIKNT